MNSSVHSVARSFAALVFFAITSCSTIVLGSSDQRDVVPFVPGEIPTTMLSSAAPALTPDGNTVYLGQSPDGDTSSIMFSRRSGGKWSVPKVATFSGGGYRDLEPAFAPNGKYLIFASSRPTGSSSAELEGHYNKQVLPGKGGNLWKVEFAKKGEDRPTALPASINSNASVFSPSVAADGSLYFMRADNGGTFHIYRSQMKNGSFEAPVLASFSDDKYGDFDPAVAPDESYMIFSSGRPPAPHVTDLFIVFRTASGWGGPIDLRSAISDHVYGIEARLSPDGKTLYFSNSRNPSGTTVPKGRYVWKVSLADLLKAHGVGGESQAR
jgi:hypothetical protein